MEDETFIDFHKKSIEHGFWTETYKSTIILLLECGYRKEILINWYISDIVVNENKVLVKWEKRLFPLTDEQLKSRYDK